MNRMKQVQEEARAALAKAKDDMAQYYNQHQTLTLEYLPEDKVYLDAKDIQTMCLSKKLSYKFLGLYVVKCAVRHLAYCLRLPQAMRSIHPVFHVVKLRPAVADLIPGRQADPPPPPIIVGNKEHYEVEAILDSCIFHHKLQYQVKWKGFGYEDSFWEPAEGVRALIQVKEFYDRHPDAPKLVWGLYTLSPALFQLAWHASRRCKLEGG